VTFEQFWLENEKALASRHYGPTGWNVYSLLKEVYESLSKKEDEGA